MKYLATLILALVPSLTSAQDLTVFAAASLKEPLDQIALTAPGVTLSYAGSGTLARQIIGGAPADLVILAHPDWMDALLAAGVIVPDTETDLLSNELVLVAPQETPDVALTPATLLDALGDDGRLAMGQTTSVPAGIYGRQALTSLGLWDVVADRLAETDSVRSALAMASRGEVPLALVYATDARADPTLKVVARFPADTHDPIRYQVAVVKGGAEDAARAFLDRLQTPESTVAFEASGFLPAGPP